MEEYYEDDEYEEEYEDDNEQEPARARHAWSLAGGTFVTSEIVAAMMHGGVLGAGLGALASAFVLFKGQEVIDGAQALIPLPPITEKLHLPTLQGRSIKDRLLGNFPDESGVDYYGYIQSPEWKARAKAIRKRDNRTCQDCGATDVKLDVHHLTYDRLGNELDEDLITLCRECHDARHGNAKPMEALQPKTAARTVDNNRLFLSETFAPAVDSFLSLRIAVLGQSGTGKSNTVAVVLEEIGPLGVPLLLLDTEDEYGGLGQHAYLPNARLVGSQDVPLSQAFVFGQMILEQRLQVILNLQSYTTDDEAALVMCDIIAGMNAWEESRPSEYRLSCMVILDEASVWLPQNAGESILSKEKDDDGMTVLSKLQRTFFSTVVRRGRKRGIGFLLATQRIAEIDKRALSATWMILQRQTLPNDLQVYAKYGIEQDQALALHPGQAFVLGPDSFRDVVQFRRRNSPDKAFTPGLASLRAPIYRPSRPVQVVQPRQEPRTDEIPATSRHTPRSSYDAHRERKTKHRVAVSVPRVQGTPARAQEPQRVQSDEIEISTQDAFRVWSAGNANVRDLAKVMGITVYQSTKLYNAMVDDGLIERKTKIAIRKD